MTRKKADKPKDDFEKELQSKTLHELLIKIPVFYRYDQLSMYEYGILLCLVTDEINRINGHRPKGSTTNRVRNMEIAKKYNALLSPGGSDSAVKVLSSEYNLSEATIRKAMRAGKEVLDTCMSLAELAALSKKVAP